MNSKADFPLSGFRLFIQLKNIASTVFGTILSTGNIAVNKVVLGRINSLLPKGVQGQNIHQSNNLVVSQHEDDEYIFLPF